MVERWLAGGGKAWKPVQITSLRVFKRRTSLSRKCTYLGIYFLDLPASLRCRELAYDLFPLLAVLPSESL